MGEFDKSKALRELSKFIGCLALLVAVVGVGYYVLDPFFNPEDTPLQAAVRAHDAEKVRSLLPPVGDSRASTEAYSVFKLTLVNLSPSDPRTTEILRLILQRNPQPRKIGLTGRTAERPADMIFVSRPRASNNRSVYRQSAVELATRQWSAEGVKALMDHGLTIRSVGVGDALVAAAANGCDPVLILLLDAGADVNAKNQHNDTPLAMARRVNNHRIVHLLLTRGARE